jgi:hypothetical protein
MSVLDTCRPHNLVPGNFSTKKLMDTSVLTSTFLLTLLLLVGLFFFIRASIKDRTEVLKVLFDPPQEPALEELRQYFEKRSYRVAAVDAQQQFVRWEGSVRPSWFLAIFLSGLAAVGSVCLALVLSMLFPAIAPASWGLLLIAPLAGVFYWRGAGRTETVSLEAKPGQRLIQVTAHRDELAELKRALPQLQVEPEAE